MKELFRNIVKDEKSDLEEFRDFIRAVIQTWSDERFQRALEAFGHIALDVSREHYMSVLNTNGLPNSEPPPGVSYTEWQYATQDTDATNESVSVEPEAPFYGTLTDAANYLFGGGIPLAHLREVPESDTLKGIECPVCEMDSAWQRGEWYEHKCWIVEACTICEWHRVIDQHGNQGRLLNGWHDAIEYLQRKKRSRWYQLSRWLPDIEFSFRIKRKK